MTRREKLIETRALSHSYPSRLGEPVVAIKNINLEIFEGEFLSLIGQNGAGKTTLAKHFNGLLKPTSGEICVEGAATSGRTVAQLSTTVGYVFQDPERMMFLDTVEQELKFGPTNMDVPPEEIQSRMEEVVARLDLKEHLASSPFQLSKAAKRRLAIGSVLTMKPKMIVMDEPSVGQDRFRTDKLMSYLQKLNLEEGLTIAVITHDMRLVAEYSERALVLSGGELIFDGKARALFSDGAVLERAGLEPPQITQLTLSMPGAFSSPSLSVIEAAEQIGRIAGGQDLGRD
jgi:energy-coupling factor transport system ATP-binding protein